MELAPVELRTVGSLPVLALALNYSVYSRLSIVITFNRRIYRARRIIRRRPISRELSVISIKAFYTSIKRRVRIVR